jgi:hypothetical protein
MLEEKDIFDNEFERQYGDSYRQGEGHCTPTHPENRFDEAPASVESSTPKAVEGGSAEDAKELAQAVMPKDEAPVTAFGHPVADYINAMLPNGAPEGSRHKFALKVASDVILLCDGNLDQVRRVLLSLPWVQDIVKERGMDEIERILQTAQKRMLKREAENYNEPQPSKEMRQAIKAVTGRSYSQLIREARLTAEGRELAAAEDDVMTMLENIGRDVEKLFPYFPVLQLLCHHLKRRHYIAALLVGGAFFMTLMTRCWYRSGMEPGRICRLNSILELIGRSGTGKHIAVDLYRLLMEPIKMSDKAQIDALNNFNAEREQNNGGAKNKSPRPKGVFRCMPSETSAAAIREAEYNAVEMIDGQEWPLHVSHFNSELQDMQRQMKRDYMNIEKLFYKGFHNEPDGSYLKTSSAPVGEYDVHFNAVYSGTQTALDKQTTTENFAGGLPFRLTAVPLGNSNFEMRERRQYTEEDAERDQKLRDWAYLLNDCKGEIPCEDIDIALSEWTTRRMQDAGEEQNFALEDLIKRPYWHGMNYSLPFIICRHWDQMVEDNGKYKCGPDFKTDKYDRQLALLIVNAQFAFQQHFFLGIGEKYYDDLQTSEASNRHHQKKTMLAYRRLPDPFSSDDVKREYGYDSVGSVCSRLKILQDDGMAQKIRSGEHKGKYRKLM